MCWLYVSAVPCVLLSLVSQRWCRDVVAPAFVGYALMWLADFRRRAGGLLSPEEEEEMMRDWSVRVGEISSNGAPETTGKRRRM